GEVRWLRGQRVLTSRRVHPAGRATGQQGGQRDLPDAVAAVAEEVPAGDWGTHRSLLGDELVEVQDVPGDGGPRGAVGGRPAAGPADGRRPVRVDRELLP